MARLTWATISCHFKTILSSVDSTPKGTPTARSDLPEDMLEWREEIDSDFTVREVHEILMTLSNGKACGPDFIYNEHLRQAQALTPLWTDLYNLCLERGGLPGS